jgi:hypothetical protein
LDQESVAAALGSLARSGSFLDDALAILAVLVTGEPAGLAVTARYLASETIIAGVNYFRTACGFHLIA